MHFFTFLQLFFQDFRRECIEMVMEGACDNITVSEDNNDDDEITECSIVDLRLPKFWRCWTESTEYKLTQICKIPRIWE